MKKMNSKYKEIFEVWKEPMTDYRTESPKKSGGTLKKVLLHPVSILFYITFSYFFYTFHRIFSR
jgi:hypothetical protein